jgi:hypothetical protein
MTLATQGRFGISRQRSYWLRCFLESEEDFERVQLYSGQSKSKHRHVKGTGFSNEGYGF